MVHLLVLLAFLNLTERKSLQLYGGYMTSTFRQLLMVVFLLLGISGIHAQTQPLSSFYAYEPGVFALRASKIVVSSTKTIENGVLIIRNGKIEQVGGGLSIPSDAIVIDLKGKTIYPGLIELHSDYGVKEDVKPVTEQRGPRNWNPTIRPEYSVINDFRPDERAAERLRKSGFSLVQLVPKSGLFKGQSSLVLLGKGTVEENVFLADNAFQNSIMTPTGMGGYPSSLMGAIALTRQIWYDASWYSNAQALHMKDPKTNLKPEYDPSLSLLSKHLVQKSRLFVDGRTELDIMRNAEIAKEFGLSPIYFGSGTEFKWIGEVKRVNPKLVLPIIFDKAPDVSSPEKITEVTLNELLEWDHKPENPALLEQNGITFAFTSRGLKDPTAFLKNVRLSVKRGLTASTALKALTETPADFAGVGNWVGTLEAGKVANFIVTNGDLFDDKTKIQENWIAGKKYETEPEPKNDYRGDYSLNDGLTLSITGMVMTPELKLTMNGKSVSVKKTKVEYSSLMGSFESDSLGKPGFSTISLQKIGNKLTGTLIWSDGSSAGFTGELTKPFEEKVTEEEKQPEGKTSFPLTFPFGSYGKLKVPEQEHVMFRNATVWTSAKDGNLLETDLEIKNGKIVAIGKKLSAKGAREIDATGYHITPGLIDAHSHSGISFGINEGGQSITAEVRVEDVLNPNDVNFYFQLAGGLTAANVMHGSANSIGGQTATIKLRWGASADNLKVKNGLPGIKFALGENPRQANWTGNRYPQTRMGVYEQIRDSFIRAKEYELAMTEWNKTKKGLQPKRDLELDPLVEILNKKRTIQCHSYVASEILHLMKIGDELGFTVGTFQHILEGYKVADEMAKRGSMASAFSDWWAFKYEVLDAIPYNGPIMHQQGVVVSYNSDDNELARRLNHEAAKAVKYGKIDEAEAFKWVTLNPAKQLGIDHLTGSLEVGKDADIVLWNHSPISIYAKPLQTWVDGRNYFDIETDKEIRKEMSEKKNALIQKVQKSGVPQRKGNTPKATAPKILHCEDMHEDYELIYHLNVEGKN